MRILRRTVLQLPAGAWAVAASDPHHRIVFQEKGRFGGWPANHGMWAWGNELLVGFEAGWFMMNNGNGREHAIDYGRPAEHVLARSLDGGERWKIERPASLKAPPNTKQAGVPTEAGGKEAVASPGGFDFTKPGFALTARMASIHTGPSRFYFSYDRGKSWQGPYQMPDFGTKGIAARTDYLIDGVNGGVFSGGCYRRLQRHCVLGRPGAADHRVSLDVVWQAAQLRDRLPRCC